MLNDDNAIASEFIYAILFLVLGLFIFIALAPFFSVMGGIQNHWVSVGWSSQQSIDTTNGMILIYRSTPYLIGIFLVLGVIAGVLAKKMGYI